MRTVENKSRHDIADYKQEAFSLTSMQANRVGVVAEMAVVKWLGLPEEVLMNQCPEVWAGYVPSSEYHKYLGQPDILGVVEVRRAHRRSNPIPIRKKDVRAGAILVQAYVDLTWNSTKVIASNEVELLGWADAPVDWNTGDLPWWSNGDARVAAEKKPMSALWPDEILSRAGVLL